MLPNGEAPRRRRPTGGKVLLILGLAIVACGITAVVLGQHHLRRNLDDIQVGSSELRSELTTYFSVPGSREVHLEPGLQTIYALDLHAIERSRSTNGEDSHYEPPLNVTVTITDARGDPVPTDLPGIRSAFDSFADARAVKDVNIPTPGTYRIEARPLADPPSDVRDVPTIGIGPPSDSLGDVLGVVGGGLAIVGGALTALLGAFLALGGAIWLLVGGRSTTPPLGPPGWAPAPGTHTPGPYTQAYQRNPYQGYPYQGSPAPPGGHPPPAPPNPPAEPPEHPPYRP